MSDPSEDKAFNLARAFTEQRQISLVLLIGVLIWGMVAYVDIPKRKDPYIPLRVATAVTIWPGADALTMEELVTRPVEETIAKNRAIHEAAANNFGIKSISQPGLSIVTLQLAEDYAAYQTAFNEIGIDLTALSSNLPDGAGPIQFNSEFGKTAALLLTLASPHEGDVEIALRARDVASSIRDVRAGTGSDARQSFIVVLPRSVDLSPMQRRISLLGDVLSRPGADGSAAIINDVRPLSGPGFVGLDYTLTNPETDVPNAVETLLQERFGVSRLHPDAWDPVAIDAPDESETRLQAVPGERYSYEDLNEFSTYFARVLRAVPEVSVVERSGQLEQRIFVEYSQEQLVNLGLSPSIISNALQTRNSTLPGGVFYLGGTETTVDTNSRFSAIEDLGNVVVGSADGEITHYLRDLSDLVPGYESPPEFLNYLSWQEPDGTWTRGKAITLSVQLRDGAQIAEFGTAVEAAIERASVFLPEDLIVKTLSSQPSQVADSITLFMTALVEAIALVLFISLIGFRDWRTALLMMLSIPLALAMTFAMIDLIGIELQQVSIAALIIALGLLVDDPVVAADAIRRGMSEGLPARKAAWIGPTRLRQAILFATLTNIVAYLPLLLLTGNTGQFLVSLPVVLTCALIGSRIVSMTFVPFLGLYLLKPEKGPIRTPEESRSTGFTGWYYRVCQKLIRHRRIALACVFPLLLLFIPIGHSLKQAFFPADVQHLFYVDIFLENDASIERTAELAREAEAVVLETVSDFAEEHGLTETGVLESMASYLGGGAPRFWFSVTPQINQVNYAQLLLRVEERTLTPEIVVPLQAALSAKIPGAVVDVRQLQTTPVTYPIALRLSADSAVTTGSPEDLAELTELRRQADKLKDLLRAIPIAERPRDDWGSETVSLELAVDPDRVALAGLTEQDVLLSTAGALNGIEMTTVEAGEENIPVLGILNPVERASITGLESVYVFSSSQGGATPLARVAELGFDLSHQRIARLEHARSVEIRAFPAEGHLPSEVMAQLSSQLAAFEAELPPGIRLQISGEQADSASGFSDLRLALAVSIGLIYLALVLQFRHILKPLLVFAAVPFGVLGALASLLFMGSPFGFMAFLGVVALIGVIVSHVIVLFDFIEERRREGSDLEEALLDAGIHRLRPVLITCSATIFALIPLAIHGGPLWQPLCYAQIGGLVVATFTTLVLVPMLYAFFVLDIKLIGWERDQGDLEPATTS
ncbi:MAG: efflux RND transporter permease subunit [Pseudomonadota bacterium]